MVVWFNHARVGHRQLPLLYPPSKEGGCFFFGVILGYFGGRMAIQQPPKCWSIKHGSGFF